VTDAKRNGINAHREGRAQPSRSGITAPISPPSSPTQWLFQGPSAESKFLAAKANSLQQDWERNVILPLAQQIFEIDLDDGVEVNYIKFIGAV